MDSSDIQAKKKAPGRDRGDGRPAVVVVVHGISGSGQTASEMASGMFRNTAPLPYEGVKTVAYDLIGRGSHPGGDDHGLDAYLDQLDAVVRGHTGAKEKVYLVGYSMGGAIALAYALKYPSRVSAVALLAPAGRVSSSGYVSTLFTSRAIWKSLVPMSLKNQQNMDARRYTESGNEELFARAVRVRERNLALLDDTDFAGVLYDDVNQFPLHRLPLRLAPGGAMPRTLVVSFTEDLIVSPAAVDKLSSALEASLGDQSRVVSAERVPGCHITPLVQPEETGKRVAEFFFAK
jgi:pimeloyl-ACP methyl ester carboxylesterase